MSRMKTLLAMIVGALCASDPLNGRPYRYVREKKGNTLADGRPPKRQERQLFEFTVHGHTVLAYSRKDAIKRAQARGLTQRQTNKHERK